MPHESELGDGVAEEVVPRVTPRRLNRFAPNREQLTQQSGTRRRRERVGRIAGSPPSAPNTCTGGAAVPFDRGGSLWSWSVLPSRSVRDRAVKTRRGSSQLWALRHSVLS